MPQNDRLIIKERPEPGALALHERQLPDPGPGEVMVRIHRAAICGTDLHLYRWNSWAERNYKPPMPMGHEFYGRVCAVGPEATLKVGDRVVAETHMYCGTCQQCRANRRHTCLNLRLFSKSGFGCFSEYTLVPQIALRVVPDPVPDHLAVIMEPLGIGVRAAMEADIRGKSVLISGCGPIGLFAVAAARALGAARVIAVDLSEARLALARAAGAHETLTPAQGEIGTLAREANGGEGLHVVIEASGSPAALNGSMECLTPGGQMILAGLPDGPVPLDIARLLINREIGLRGIYGRLIDETWLAMEALLVSGAINVEPILTHSFELGQFDEAFSTAASGQAGKVVLQLA